MKPRFDVDESVASTQSTVAVRSDSGEKKRRQIIVSVVTSEELYVKDLSLLQDVLLVNLQTVLTAGDVAEIFGSLEQIVTESKALLVIFQRKVRTEEGVGDLFLNMAKLFETLVVPWAANQVTRVCALERLSSSNSGVASCLQSIMEEFRGLSIYEMLSKPVRHAMDFQQMVAMMLGRSPPPHPDHALLTEANEVMTRVKDAMSGPTEELDNLLKVVALQNSLQGQESLVSPTRKFVREVALQEVMGKKTSERKAYLLSDQLVVVKLKRTGFGQPAFFPLNRISVAPVADQGALRNVWELTLNQGAAKKDKIRFAMASPAERDSFLKALEAQIVAQVSGATAAAASAAGTTDTFGKKSGFIKILRPGQRSFSVSDDAPPAISPLRQSRLAKESPPPDTPEVAATSPHVTVRAPSCRCASLNSFISLKM